MFSSAIWRLLCTLVSLKTAILRIPFVKQALGGEKRKSPVTPRCTMAEAFAASAMADIESPILANLFPPMCEEPIVCDTGENDPSTQLTSESPGALHAR